MKIQRYCAFMISALLLSFTTVVANDKEAHESSVHIRVKGVSCTFCVYGIEKKIKNIPDVLYLKTDYKKSLISLQRKKGSHIDIKALEQAVADAGFSVDSISLRIQGILTEWEGKPALKENDSHQLFLLIESGRKEPHAFLSEQKLKALKETASEGQNIIWLQGEAHYHGDIPLAITVLAYGKL